MDKEESTTGADRRFQVFHTADAPLLLEADVMQVSPLSPDTLEGITRLVENGYQAGDVVRIVFNIPGFSLTHAWLKAHYPLTRHSHDADCLYYIIAGTIELGSQKLGARDGFFVPAKSAYTYRPGPEGVELLEFRHATKFDISILPASAAFWEKALETCLQNKETWVNAAPPTPTTLGRSAPTLTHKVKLS